MRWWTYSTDVDDGTVRANIHIFNIIKSDIFQFNTKDVTNFNEMIPLISM